MKTIYCVTAVFCLCLAGCSSLPKSGNNARSTGAYQANLVLSDEAIKLINADANALILPANAPKDAIIIYAAKKEDPALQSKAIAYALIMKSDQLCEQYMANIVKLSRWTSGSLKTSSIVFSTAAGLATPARSANLLGGLSTLTASTEDTVRKEAFNSKAPELLYKAVMAERTASRTRLMSLLAKDELGDNAAILVMAQIEDYHALCGPTVALNALAASVDTAQAEAQKNGQVQADQFVKSIQ